MKCQLVQTDKIADHNLAEQEMLDFLKNLPETDFVYREFKLTPAYEEQTRGLEEQRPDFVVVGPRVGLVSIEVKDWNLTTNRYEWLDQYQIKKFGPDGREDYLTNPVDQISRYLHGFMDLLKEQGGGAYVTSVVAFPRLSRAEFLNKLANVNLLQNPQSKYYLNLDKTLFKEDLDKYFLNPESLMISLVGRKLDYSDKEIEQTNRILLPPKFVVGDFSRRQANQQKLRILSEQQRDWIFGVDRQMNYLLDVPGSGKTNALVSKALHFVDQSRPSSTKVLITTYSRNLAINIQRILDSKIRESAMGKDTYQSIVIQSVPDLAEQVLATLCSRDEIEQHRNRAGFDEWARENVKEILSLEPQKFKVFDAIFIDEIQDFDNFYLLLLDHFVKQKNYFLVGDIGQKIFDRQYDLALLGIIPHRIELPKSFQMYRTPALIGKLAVRFVYGDAHCRAEFEQNGYREDFDHPNSSNFAAEILRSSDPALDLLRKIQDLLRTKYAVDDILIITSASLLQEVEAKLKEAGIPSKIGESEADGLVALVDFQDAKGLEREIVLVAGIEDLYEGSKPEGLFWDVSEKIRREGLSRRMIYVAITRTIEQLIIYYGQPTNCFVSELLKINEAILAKHG